MCSQSSAGSDGLARAFRITTSWDDGHPRDLKLAELLAKHGLPATFYVPLQSERPTMSQSDLQQLAQGFEIGAHTLNHAMLTDADAAESRRQIQDSKDWIEQVTGRECEVFCPPRGRFNSLHERQIAAAGFRGLRTVEMMAVDGVRVSAQLALLPTTIQAHPHHWSAYLRNGLKRGSFRGLCRLLCDYCNPWETFAERLVERAKIRGGVFHLWGHSWEIDENGQWENLERVFDRLSRLVRTTVASAETNGSLCRAASVEATPQCGSAAAAIDHVG